MQAGPQSLPRLLDNATALTFSPSELEIKIKAIKFPRAFALTVMDKRNIFAKGKLHKELLRLEKGGK